MGTLESGPQQRRESFVDPLIKEAYGENIKFLFALDNAQDLQKIKEIITRFSLTDGDGEDIIFEIVEQPGEEIDAVTFSQEELLGAIDVMESGAPEGYDIKSLIPHKNIADAVMRILKQNHGNQ